MKAQPAIFSIKLLKTTLFVLLLFSLPKVCSQSIPLPNAFACNDYLHGHQLFAALENGHTNTGSNRFLKDGRPIAAHIDVFFKKELALDALYLQPLAERIATTGEEIYRGYHAPVILIIGAQTGAGNTYNVLKVLLEKYRPVFSSFDHGRVFGGMVTVVIPGYKHMN